MSMKALNQLVARSIVDPSILNAFSHGEIGTVMSEMDFTADVRSSLEQLEANSWAEFATLAYRLVKAKEDAVRHVHLPSPLEGLLPGDARADEQVA